MNGTGYFYPKEVQIRMERLVFFFFFKLNLDVNQSITQALKISKPPFETLDFNLQL